MTSRLFPVLLLVVLFASRAAASVVDVWIDADPACAMGRADDVDDCWAIVAAVRSSRLNVIGLGTVFGNVGLEKATATGRALLAAIRTHEPARRPPRLFVGAARPISEDPAAVPDAASALESALSEHPLTVLALGPLTNIAIVLRRRPDLVRRITAIVAVAGQAPGQVFKVGRRPILHFHDLNLREDSNAFETVLRSGVPIHLIPFELGSQAVVTGDDLERLIARGGLDRWIGLRSRPWLAFWQTVLGASGFSPFDTLAVAYLTRPKSFSCLRLPAKIVRRRGLFVVRDTLEIAPFISQGQFVTYCPRVSPRLRNSIADFLTDPDGA